MSEHSFSDQPAGADITPTDGHAVARGWGEMAYTWIGSYARAHRTFIGEECTKAARAEGMTPPHDPRAWGSVFRRAAREGIIRRVGYAQSPQRHFAPTPLWQSEIHDGAGDTPAPLPEREREEADGSNAEAAR